VSSAGTCFTTLSSNNTPVKPVMRRKTEVSNLWSSEMYRRLIWYISTKVLDYPCGGGVEYLHRDPANRKRRRNGTKKGRAIA
jgi:hypothetical protein